MIKHVITLLCAIAVAQAMTFEEYVKKYNFGWKYGSNEYALRERLFNAAVQKIKAHNAGSSSYKMGINKFTAMKQGEMPLGFSKKTAAAHTKKPMLKSEKPFEMKATSDLPRSVDWRRHGIVSPVKDQGHCGSCWAFAATATLESHIAKETGLLFDLSPEQIASCSENPNHCGGTGGCEGATAEIAFEYAAQSSGLFQEFQYPYTSYYGQDENCKTDLEGQVAGITGYHMNTPNNYTELMNAVATVGPIAVSVDASNWGSYESGIYDGCGDSSSDINHAVTLVGYGESLQGKYWLIRNSWSPEWGEGGYIKLRRTDDDETFCAMDETPQDGSACDGETEPVKVCGSCGVLSDTSFPTGGYIVGDDDDGRKP